VRHCVSSANLKNEEAMARNGSLRHKEEKLFLKETLKIVVVYSFETSSNDVPSDAASQLRRQKSSITPLLKPQNSQEIRSV